MQDTKPGWRKLKVQVHRSGVQVRSRSGYFVNKPQDNPATEQQLRGREIAQALSSPLEFTSVGFDAEIDPAKDGKSGKKVVGFHLDVMANGIAVDTSDNNHIRIDFLAVAKAPDGTIAAQAGQTIEAHLKPENLAKVQQSGTTYNNALELAPGEYQLKFVVRDALTGRMGTVTAPVKVE